jgi:AcrR family transcriptional regulator
LQPKRSPRANRERSDATRRALIGAARRLFVRHGYAGTSTPGIVAAAGLTRGALYHHFEDKRALFRAVVEAEARAVADQIEASAGAAAGPLPALLAGAAAYLGAMAAPGRARLLLVDGPAVLGPELMRDIDERSSALTLREGLRAAAAPLPGGVALERLTPLVSAAFDRAALDLAAGASPRAVEAAMRFLLGALAAAGAGRTRAPR